MIAHWTSSVCDVCTIVHHNQWLCGNCRAVLGNVVKGFIEQRIEGVRVNVTFKFCPFCGYELREEAI